MGALLALIPARDWFYGALAVGALVMGWHYYQKYEAAITYANDIKSDSILIKQEADLKLSQQDADYAAKLKEIRRVHIAAIEAAAATTNDLITRLRKYEAAGRQCPVLGGAAPAPTGGAAGTGGAGELIQAVAALAAAAAHDTVVCQTERLERDALTGK
jgi:hypothetical protein